jgi:hypothetical protein
MFEKIRQLIFGVRVKGEYAYNETHFRIRTCTFKNKPPYKEWRKQLKLANLNKYDAHRE